MTNNIEEPKMNLPAVDVTPMGMLQLAIEKDADIDQLTKLMDLQERWEKNEAQKAYTAAMMLFQEECPFIGKKRAGHNTKYANLADTLKQIKPLMKEHGFVHNWKTEQEGGNLKVTCCVTHTQGHKEYSSMTAGADKSGSKNDVQAIGSTNTYLQRYTLFSVLGLASIDQDDDANILDNPVITDEQKDVIVGLIKEVGIDTKAFLGWLGVGSVDEIQAKNFNRAKAELEKKRAK